MGRLFALRRGRGLGGRADALARRRFSAACEVLEGRELLATAGAASAPLPDHGASAFSHAVVEAGHRDDRPALDLSRSRDEGVGERSRSASAPGLDTSSTRGPASRDAAFLQAVQRVMGEFHVPGAVAGVWTPGRRPWVAAQGLADVADGRPISLRDRFPIRSVTKSFTVTLVLQLARTHKLSLNDPIEKYVPGIPNGDRITLAELAGMTSGVKNYTEVPAFVSALVDDLGRQWTAREIVAEAIPESPVFAPGTRYDYSNTNTLLLGMVAEQVTGRPLAQLYRARILRPLGLSATSYPDSASLPSPRATPYLVDPATGEADAIPDANLSAFGAAGGMVSTLGNLRGWGLALGTGRLIGPRLLGLAERSARPATDGPEYDRYGLGIGELEGWWGHTGEGLGFQAAVFFGPATRSVIAVALNSSQPTNVATEIFKALAPLVRPASRT